MRGITAYKVDQVTVYIIAFEFCVDTNGQAFIAAEDMPGFNLPTDALAVNLPGFETQ